MSGAPGAGHRLTDRRSAGRLLVARLAGTPSDRALVLALPRGGVPVAFEIAGKLGCELDVLVVRKVGAPGNPEYGLGAVAEGGLVYLDVARVAEAGLTREGLAPEIRSAQREVERRAAVYREGRPRASLRDRAVILVDDGVATGGTVIAAARAAREEGARSITVSLGVCPPESVPALEREADAVVSLLRPSGFFAVGEWYEDFVPTSDAEVLRLLAESRRP